MGKNPAFQFYPNDWIGDTELAMCTPATRGIWITALCRMWYAKERGKLVGTVEQMTRLLACSATEWQQFLDESRATEFATVTERNKKVTLINRRMYEAEKERKAAAIRQKRHRVRSLEKYNGKSNTKVTPLSSSSTSSSIERENNGVTEKPYLSDVKSFFVSDKLNSDPDTFFNWYESRGWPDGDWQALARVWETREKKNGKSVDNRKCVCGALGHKFQEGRDKQKVWLCAECLAAVQSTGTNHFGLLSRSQILELVEKGKLIGATDK